jgi:membrane protease YdiL (CAAX protease family)
MAHHIYGIPIPNVIYIPVLFILFIGITVIGIPLSGLAAVFGEEYGWRGFLQSEFIKMGKLKGVVSVGLIWGIWHFPVILRGIHTYPPTFFGLFLGLLFFVLWGIIQGYAVLITGSIWIPAFMHGVVNSVYSFMLTYIVRPDDILFSYGLGIYGMVFIGGIVFFILKDSIWRMN